MKSGDQCESCMLGYYEVYSSKRFGNRQRRYLRCCECHHRPERNIEVVDADLIRRRRQKVRTFLGKDTV
jgi:hypothetical protein